MKKADYIIKNSLSKACAKRQVKNILYQILDKEIKN
jgi:dephospho-CoA kinase